MSVYGLSYMWYTKYRKEAELLGSDAHNSATIRYNRARDNIMIRPTKDEGAEIRQAAAAAGKSVQAYIMDVLRDARTTADNR